MKTDKVEKLNWSCEVTALDSQQEKELEVGDLFGVICNSSTSQSQLEVPIKIQPSDEKLKFFYKILETRSVSPGRLDFVVTTYKVKGHNQVPFSFVDVKGHTGQSAPLALKVKSVIDKSQLQQGQVPQAYGPIGPYKIKMPWWYMASWITAGIFLLMIVFLYIHKFFKRKKFLEKLEHMQSALGPYGQANKEIRKLSKSVSLMTEESFTTEKGLKFLNELDQILKLYLTTELKVQALDQNFNKTLKEIKRNHKFIFKKCGIQLIKFNKEISRLLISNKVFLYDCEQIAFMAKNLVISIHTQHQRRAQ